MRTRHLTMLLVVMAAVLIAVDSGWAQRGRGRGAGGPGRGGQGRGGPPWADPQFVADRDMFHFLLANGDKIQRKVTMRSDGVETVTESDDTEVAAKIQEHVVSMHKRITEGRPIHMRDPLFAALFQKADKIKMEYEKTDKGVRVVETSDDPYTAKLIKAHAKVVSRFVKRGFEEARKNHKVPKP